MSDILDNRKHNNFKQMYHYLFRILLPICVCDNSLLCTHNLKFLPNLPLHFCSASFLHKLLLTKFGSSIVQKYFAELE